MRGKNRFFTILAALLLWGALSQPTLAALTAFQPQEALLGKGFRDVVPGRWYYQVVMDSSALGLIQGYEDGTFKPAEPISLAEVTALAVRIYETYHGIAPEGQPNAVDQSEPAATDEVATPTEAEDQPTVETAQDNQAQETDFRQPEEIAAAGDIGAVQADQAATPAAEEVPDSPAPAEAGQSPVAEEVGDVPLPEEPSPQPADKETPQSQPWYQPYVEKAIAYQLLPDQWQEYNEPASRRRAVYLLTRALPETELAARNEIESIPDVAATEFGYQEILRCYQSGVLAGSDAYGHFLPENSISRAEVSALVVRLLQPEQRLDVRLPTLPQHQVFAYGQSGAGRELTVHRIGTGENVLIGVFGLHGYEDGWPQDGVELDFIARRLIEELAANQLLTVKDWSVYIVPCANPDGLQDGWTANGPGRCTTHLLNADGQTVYGQGKGIDLNRCFSFGFSINTNRRNYTGSQPLGAVEAVALKDLIETARSSSGHNILVDVHGWTQQLIAKNPRGKLTQFFAARFPQNRLTYNGAHGYLTEWSQSIGYDSLLFELPRDVLNHERLIQKQYDRKLIQCFLDVLAEY